MPNKSASRGEANVSLSAITLGSSVAGDSFALPHKPGKEGWRNFTWTIDFAAAPTTPDLRLQGSLDNTAWFDLDTYTGTTDTMRHVVDKPVLYIRGFISAGSGTNVTVAIFLGS